jgi:uncharacterized membrane protein YdjX (TVP38/TMEM64 family)
MKKKELILNFLKTIFRKNNFKFILYLFFLLHSSYLYLNYSLDLTFNSEKMQLMITELGTYGPFGFIISFVMSSLFFYPVSTLAKSSGAVWGIALGFFYNMIGLWISCVISFSIARYLARKFIYFKIIKSSKLIYKLDIFLLKHSFIFMLFSRLFLGAYIDLLSIFAGLSAIRKNHFMSATFLGIIPSAITYSILGYYDLSFGLPILPIYLSFCGLVLLIILIYDLIWLKIKKKKILAEKSHFTSLRK